MPIDAYLLCRAAATRGSEVVVRVMKRYPDRRDVQAQGFLQLATFDYPGTVITTQNMLRGGGSMTQLSGPVRGPATLRKVLAASLTAVGLWMVATPCRHEGRRVFVQGGGGDQRQPRGARDGHKTQTLAVLPLLYLPWLSLLLVVVAFVVAAFVVAAFMVAALAVLPLLQACLAVAGLV